MKHSTNNTAAKSNNEPKAPRQYRLTEAERTRRDALREGIPVRMVREMRTRVSDGGKYEVWACKSLSNAGLLAGNAHASWFECKCTKSRQITDMQVLLPKGITMLFANARERAYDASLVLRDSGRGYWYVAIVRRDTGAEVLAFTAARMWAPCVSRKGLVIKGVCNDFTELLAKLPKPQASERETPAQDAPAKRAACGTSALSLDDIISGKEPTEGARKPRAKRAAKPTEEPTEGARKPRAKRASAKPTEPTEEPTEGARKTRKSAKRAAAGDDLAAVIATAVTTALNAYFANRK